jgi:hypothetical protein
MQLRRLALLALVLLLPLLGLTQNARAPQSPTKTAAPIDSNQAILQDA